MEYFVNKESKKIYNKMGEDSFLDKDTGELTKKHFMERLFDFRIYPISDEVFNTKYEPLTPEQAHKVELIAPSMLARQAQLTLDQLNRVNPDAMSGGNAEALQEEVGGVGRLVETTELDSLDRLIVQDKVKESIMTGIELITNREAIDEKWGISEVSPMKGRCIMNMVGPPGTGKTMSAKCIASHLGKKLYQVDYAEIISKYVGETGKNIRAAFEAAKKHDAILFFDEADSLMSRRVQMPQEGESNSINQNRNILMQELDKYDGIMLTSTNFFMNYDEALLRRISRHIHFELPDKDMRKKLILQQLPSKTKERLDDDVNFELVANASEGFSGGDIVNVCSNAILRAVTQKCDTLKLEHLMDEVAEIKKNKATHGKKTTLNRVGF